MAAAAPVAAIAVAPAHGGSAEAIDVEVDQKNSFDVKVSFRKAELLLGGAIYRVKPAPAFAVFGLQFRPSLCYGDENGMSLGIDHVSGIYPMCADVKVVPASNFMHQTGNLCPSIAAQHVPRAWTWHVVDADYLTAALTAHDYPTLDFTLRFALLRETGDVCRLQGVKDAADLKIAIRAQGAEGEEEIYPGHSVVFRSNAITRILLRPADDGRLDLTSVSRKMAMALIHLRYRGYVDHDDVDGLQLDDIVGAIGIADYWELKEEVGYLMQILNGREINLDNIYQLGKAAALYDMILLGSRIGKAIMGPRSCEFLRALTGMRSERKRPAAEPEASGGSAKRAKPDAEPLDY